MLSSDEIVPFYAAIGRILDKPHTLGEEIERMRLRFPYSPGVTRALDALQESLRHFSFREEDSESLVAIHRKAIALAGASMTMVGSVAAVEVGVAIKVVVDEGSAKFQEMDSAPASGVPFLVDSLPDHVCMDFETTPGEVHVGTASGNVLRAPLPLSIAEKRDIVSRFIRWTHKEDPDE